MGHFFFGCHKMRANEELVFGVLHKQNKALHVYIDHDHVSQKPTKPITLSIVNRHLSSILHLNLDIVWNRIHT